MPKKATLVEAGKARDANTIYYADNQALTPEAKT